MSWEDRNGSRYYYRKRREGKRVISEYIGNGLSGMMAEEIDGEDRQKVEQKRRELRKQKQQAAAIDSRAGEVEEMTQLFTDACLLLAGYHVHKGQWRKARE
jgi:hypothetical protein